MYSLQLSRFLHIQSLFLQRSLSSPHGGSEVRALASLPGLPTAGTGGAGSFPLLSPLHTHPVHQLLPPPSLQHLFSKVPDDLPIPRSDRLFMYSFIPQIFIGLSLFQLLWIHQKKRKKIKTPAACSKHLSARLTGPPRSPDSFRRSPPLAAGPLLLPPASVDWSSSAHSLPPLPLPALDHSCFPSQLMIPPCARFGIVILTPSTSQ